MSENFDVLVIDENPTEFEYVRSGAEDLPFNLEHVGSLGDALRAFSVQDFHAVLLDLKLPDTDGVEGVKELRCRQPHIAIVVFANRPYTPELHLRCRRAGAQAFCGKSQYDVPSLCQSILNAILVKSTENHLLALNRLQETALLCLREKLREFSNHGLMDIVNELALRNDDMLRELLGRTTQEPVVRSQAPEARGQESGVKSREVGGQEPG